MAQARFSLKWLFVGIAGVALLCGWIADHVRLARRLQALGNIVDQKRLLELLSEETERRNEAETERDRYQAAAHNLNETLYSRMHSASNGWLIVDGYSFTPEWARELCETTWIEAV